MQTFLESKEYSSKQEMWLRELSLPLLTLQRPLQAVRSTVLSGLMDVYVSPNVIPTITSDLSHGHGSSICEVQASRGYVHVDCEKEGEKEELFRG